MGYLINRRGFLAGATSAGALMARAGGVRAEGGS
jgi:hypothetical protein